MRGRSLILGDFALPHGNQDDAASNHHDSDSVPKAEQIWFKPQFSCLPGTRGRSQLAERAWKSPSSSVAAGSRPRWPDTAGVYQCGRVLSRQRKARGRHRPCDPML